MTGLPALLPVALACSWAALPPAAAFAPSLIPARICPTLGTRGPRAGGRAMAAPSFAVSEEPLEPQESELQPQWFDQWGFARPDPPRDKQMGFSAGAGKKGKGKKAAPPKAGSNSKLSIKAPSRDLLTVVRAEGGGDDLSEWGVAARASIDAHLATTGALLLRGLPMRSADEFAVFWKAVLAVAPAWVEGTYCSNGPSAGRPKLSGIDMATNVPPQFLLLCHNEMAYNPLTVEQIALYCIQDAPVGGESLITRNRDLLQSLSPSTMKFLKEKGGITYTRDFYDAKKPPLVKTPGVGSWQEKCGLPDGATKEECDAFWHKMGFVEDQILWGDDGTLHVKNYHPGVVQDPETGEDVWWNVIHTGSFKATDGTPFSKKMVEEIQRTGWEHTYSWKLRPGDWLMLDNMRMQHGRLPFANNDTTQRCLLTVYSNPRKSF